MEKRCQNRVWIIPLKGVQLYSFSNPHSCCPAAGMHFLIQINILLGLARILSFFSFYVLVLTLTINPSETSEPTCYIWVRYDIECNYKLITQLKQLPSIDLRSTKNKNLHVPFQFQYILFGLSCTLNKRIICWSVRLRENCTEWRNRKKRLLFDAAMRGSGSPLLHHFTWKNIIPGMICTDLDHSSHIHCIYDPLENNVSELVCVTTGVVSLQALGYLSLAVTFSIGLPFSLTFQHSFARI